MIFNEILLMYGFILCFELEDIYFLRDLWFLQAHTNTVYKKI